MSKPRNGLRGFESLRLRHFLLFFLKGIIGELQQKIIDGTLHGLSVSSARIGSIAYPKAILFGLGQSCLDP